jgi:hypothetical protein
MLLRSGRDGEAGVFPFGDFGRCRETSTHALRRSF